jgi:hypothetical protein
VLVNFIFEMKTSIVIFTRNTEMKGPKHLLVYLLIILAFLVSGCGVNFITATSTPELSAPPVEGEKIAPPLEASAEEIVINKNTPSGVCTFDIANENLICFNTTGKQFTALQVPGIGDANSREVHIAGSLISGALPPAVVYRIVKPEQELITNANGSKTVLRKTSTFIGLVGANGEPGLAFSEMTFDGAIPHSFLYTGTLGTLSQVTAFYDLKDELTGMVLEPVGVDAAGGGPNKVWYTRTAWGIGGADMIYQINRGLYVYDLATNQNMQALDAERNFQGISTDHSLAGSISFDIKGDHSLQVNNLTNGKTANFPLNPSSDRGAGYSVFSVDGKYAAWLEASGSTVAEPPNFTTRVRIGEIASETIIQEIDSKKTAQILGWKEVYFMKPVGWLNSKTVVIEARGTDWSIASLLKYDIGSANLTVLCQGIFAGFTYS